MRNLILLSFLSFFTQPGAQASLPAVCKEDVTLFSQADAFNRESVSEKLTITGSDISDYSEVYYGDLTLTTQEEVDGFYYNEITGSLTISGESIDNINMLSVLNVVGGTLIYRITQILQASVHCHHWFRSAVA